MTSLTKEREFYDAVQAGQLNRLGGILVGGLIVWVAGLFFPDFFQYRYLGIGPDFFGDIFRFWPFLAWGGGLTLLIALFGSYSSSAFDEEFLQRGIVTSIGAGVTEEFWYRGVGVFFSMLVLVVSNFLFNTIGFILVMMLGVGVLILVGSFFAVEKIPPTFLNIAGRIFALVASGTMIWGFAIFGSDVVYKVYQHLFFPAIDFMTLGLLKPVLNGDHQLLLVMGMFSANIAFRDGHKYQGLFGWTNAWYAGCVFIFATLNYGIWVALVVHAVYDILIHVVVYLGRKFRG